MPNKIICQQCKHYYVTWDSASPHGCRAYGFKSKTICSIIVKQSSNMDCNLFMKKYPTKSIKYDTNNTQQDDDEISISI